jgi:hypothetical protein
MFDWVFGYPTHTHKTQKNWVPNPFMGIGMGWVTSFLGFMGMCLGYVTQFFRVVWVLWVIQLFWIFDIERGLNIQLFRIFEFGFFGPEFFKKHNEMTAIKLSFLLRIECWVRIWNQIFKKKFHNFLNLKIKLFSAVKWMNGFGWIWTSNYQIHSSIQSKIQKKKLTS